MKMAGFLLLIAGWLLVMSAAALLRTEVSRGGFMLAGLGVQLLGLVLVFRAHLVPRGGRP